MLRSLALSLVLLAVAPAFAQSEIVGDWSGVIDVSAMVPDGPQLIAVLHVQAVDSGYTATFDSPDQGAFGLPMDDVVFDGETFSAALPAAQANYTGTFDADSMQIRGEWTQGGRALPLVLTPYEAPAEGAGSAKPADIKPGDYSGEWAGAVALPSGGEFRMVFTLALTEDGAYTVLLDAPGQEQLNLGEITVDGRNVTIPIMGQATFRGMIADDERSMEGEVEQAGQKQPLTLTRR